MCGGKNIQFITVHVYDVECKRSEFNANAKNVGLFESTNQVHARHI